MFILEVLSETIHIDDDIEHFLLQHLRTIELEKGAILQQANVRDRNLYFVENGLLRTYYIENGKEVTLSFTKEKGLVSSKETLFLNQPSRNTIEALETTSISYLNFESLQTFADTSISVSRLMIYVMGVLAINSEKRILALQYLTARERYNQLMEEYPDILLRTPLRMVASYLGMTQETLSRIRKG